MPNIKNKREMIIAMIAAKGYCFNIGFKGENLCTLCILAKHRLCNASPEITLSRCKAAALEMNISNKEIFDILL